jgi:hypothetical protein
MIQSAASNAEASTTPNPINFPGETPNGTVPLGNNNAQDSEQGGASGDGGFGGGGQGDGGFSGGGGGGSLIVVTPIIVDPTTKTNPN